MTNVSTSVRNCLAAILALGLTALAASPAAADATCERTIRADVAAIDQPIQLNRHGATIPGGMIYALLGDVVDNQSGKSCAAQGVRCRAGDVRLRDDKRPRPIVLRIDEGDCLEVRFTNLLSPQPRCFDISGNDVSCNDSAVVLEQPSTRAVSLHVQGLNWFDGPQDDGSYVGENCNSIPQPEGGQTANACANCRGNAVTYKLYGEHEGTYYLYGMGDSWTPLAHCFPFKRGFLYQGGPAIKAGGGDGGHLPEGLFGAVNVEPKNAEYYRSQVTEQDLCLASADRDYSGGKCRRKNPEKLPVIDYQAVYPEGYRDPLSGLDLGGQPILAMLWKDQLVASDLNAVITGPHAGRFPADPIPGTDVPQDPSLRQIYAYPERLQPYREFTIIYHESFQVDQAFPFYYEQIGTLVSASDAFGINYSMEGLSSPIAANRLAVGPLKECVNCQYEEFFLSSWTAGDPGMVVDHPVTDCVSPTTGELQKCEPATKALYPDDPSNVYHAYVSDHVKFRVMHAGADLHHLHHQHAHQWLATPNSPNGDYLDSQSIGPGSSFTMEMVYNGSGNVNQTVGDSIFHCHFYPHFASGMWGLWRVHDTFEPGTRLDPSGVVARDARALPDSEIVRGTPIPAVVPMPTLPMAPMPSAVRLTDGGKLFEACTDGSFEKCVGTLDAGPLPAGLASPGYPFYIPGIAGSRAPHPPADFAWAFSGCRDEKFNGTVCTPHVLGQPNTSHRRGEPAGCVCNDQLNGGLPRNVFLAKSISKQKTGVEPKTFTLLSDFVRNWLPFLNQTADENAPAKAKEKLAEKQTEARIHLQFANMDYSKEINLATSQELPEHGTTLETLGMIANARRFHDTQRPDGSPATGADGFVLNGLPPAPGAPYADPCIQLRRRGGPAEGLPRATYPSATLPPFETVPRNGVTDRYLGVNLQIDAIFNKEGWHFPQQRVITLWGDAFPTLRGARPPEPLFMRVNSYDCMEYVQANLVPRIYELDDFQVRTPTDVLGQHIHLVKFDVTSSDGSANGWNYEDGTFAPNEVTERIEAINKSGGLLGYDTKGKPFDQANARKLAAKPIKFFGPGPLPDDTSWVGAQATIQRWYDDPLLNNYGLCVNADDKLPGAGTHLCTLAATSSCPESFSDCDASGGVCSNSTAAACLTGDLAHCPTVCTAGDTSRCGAGNATCIPAHDRTIRSIFTHDHFSPSTHQQAGLYAGVIVEPKGSVWLDNQTGQILGGWNARTNTNLVGRAAEENGTLQFDGGPTSWQAVIQAPVVQNDWVASRQNGGSTTYREFLFQLQDSTLQYQPFNRIDLSSEVRACTNDTSRVCQSDGDCPVKHDRQGRCEALSVCRHEMSKICVSDAQCGGVGECEPVGACSNTGVCSNRPTGPPCLVGPPGLPDSMQAQLDQQFCGPGGGTCRIVIAGGLRGCTDENFAYCASTRLLKGIDGKLGQPYSGVESCDHIPGIPSTTWSAGRAIDAGGGVEVITFKNATNSFSSNYRNEPLYDRFNASQGANAMDMAFIYSSKVERPGLVDSADLCPVYNEDFAPCVYCSDNGAPCTTSDLSQCGDPQTAYCAPYPPLTPGIEPGDPFTPLLRAYPGDDVQLRTLMGAHINPHNFTIHGMNWPMEPSFVDSGWRNSQVMGISEHFEELIKVPSTTSAGDPASDWSDYLYKSGAAAIEQSGGNWGLLRAYNQRQDDLEPLSINEPPFRAGAATCPDDAPLREYQVVALPAATALPSGSLVYNYRLNVVDPGALLFFDLADPKLEHCTAPSFDGCFYNGEPTPLVLRATAGECIQVTLYNAIPSDICNQVPGICRGVNFTPRPNNGKFGEAVPSFDVGLHPQLVAYDVRAGDGGNVGFNPTQTVPPQQSGKAASSRTYTWYAGHYAPVLGRHVPIEFGAANLLPPDPLNHYGMGLFGGLIIEPPGSSWEIESDPTRARVSYAFEAAERSFPGSFREFVVFQQDDLPRSIDPRTKPGGNRPVNAVNYKSEYLRNGVPRYCTKAECEAQQESVFKGPYDVSCMLSQDSWCPEPEGGGCVPCGDQGFPETPIFEACAGEQVRFRLLHPGGTNTNETFELAGHTFAEAPYMTVGEGCFPHTQHVNLAASQFVGDANLCGLMDWLGVPDLGREGATASLNEWKASRMGQGPTNHNDALIWSAGGPNKVPGDYFYRSYSADHFNLGMWGIFRVLPADSEKCGGM